MLCLILRTSGCLVAAVQVGPAVALSPVAAVALGPVAAVL